MAPAKPNQAILLIEDNPHDADLTRIAFKRNGIANPILHIRNGEEALHYLFGLSAADLPLAVVLDLKLPKVSGIEVLQGIRENDCTRDLPVLVLTSSKEAKDTTACSALGVSAYLQKPVSFQEFDRVVKHIAGTLAKLNNDPSNAMAMEI